MPVDIGSWGWPQIVYISLGVLGLGYSIAKHGQPGDPYSMWRQLLLMAIAWSLLAFGGFFA